MRTASFFSENSMPVPRLILVFALAASIQSLTVRGGEDTDFQKARGFYTLQEYQLAADALTKFVGAYPKSERLEDAKLLLAESYYQLKNYADAAKQFDAFVADFPKSAHRPDALLRAARAFSNGKDYRNTLKHAHTYLEENREAEKTAAPQDPIHHKFATALYDAGDSSYELKDFAKAQAYWEELLTKTQQPALMIEANYGLGWIYFNAKNYEKAAAAFHAVAEQPNNLRIAWSKLMEGRSLAELKKASEAIAAIRLAPTLPGADDALKAESQLRLTELLLNSDNPTEMLANLRVLAKDYAALPSTPPTIAQAASKMYTTKHFAETVELADLYLTLTAANPAAAPSRAPIARMKGRSLLELNRTAEAVAAARTAVTEAAALTDAKLKEEEQPASMMLLGELMSKDATPIYKDLVEKFPQTRFAPAAQYELARLAGEAGRIDEALAYAEALLESLKTAPANDQTAKLKRDALFAAGEFAFRKPDHKKSAAFADEYQKEYGDKDEHADDVARKLAWSLHGTGDDAGAIKVLDAALNAFPKSAHRDEMLYVRAAAANKTGNAADAIKFNELLTHEITASPFVDDALFDSAVLQFKEKQYDAALAKLNQILDKPAPKPELKNIATQLRASARLQLNQFPGALADASDLLDKSADDPKLNLPALRLIKAVALLSQQGKESDALTALNDLIAKGPADAPEVRQGLSRRAYLLFAQKKYADAKADFMTLSDPAKAATPQEAADAALRLAVIHLELKEAPLAKALLEKLADQKLEGVATFDVPNLLGNILFEANDNAGAVKMYDRALTAGAQLKDLPPSKLAATRLNLAFALRRSNEKEKAEKMFADVVSGDPKGPYVAEALFERASVLVALSKNADAMPLWKDIVENHATSDFAQKALFLLGQAQAQAGNFKEAAESFEAHANKYPAVNLRETLCGLGESRLHLSESEKARDAFTKALGAKGLDADLILPDKSSDDVAERALLGLSDIALKSGDAPAAKHIALRILTEDPQSAWADAALFIAGQASEMAKEPERAIGYYRKLIADCPKSIHLPAAQDRLRALGAPK